MRTEVTRYWMLSLCLVFPSVHLSFHPHEPSHEPRASGSYYQTAKLQWYTVAEVLRPRQRGRPSTLPPGLCVMPSDAQKGTDQVFCPFYYGK